LRYANLKAFLFTEDNYLEIAINTKALSLAQYHSAV